MLTEQREWFYDVDKGGLGARTGVLWGKCGGPTPALALHHRKAPDGPGSAPSCLVPVGKLTLARENQEEAQMSHCPTSSKVKSQQCVWPWGLDTAAAWAPSAAKIKALGQQHALSLGTQSASLFHRPIPHTSLRLVFTIPHTEHYDFQVQEQSEISF